MVIYVCGAVAVLAAILVITRTNAVHALLWLIVSLLAVAVIFYAVGAPFVAALEVIIYAGAIMVLFVFVIMMLNLGPGTSDQRPSPRAWAGPAVASLVLLVQLIVVLRGEGAGAPAGERLPIEEVSAALFGPYVLGVELVSILLLAGLVAAYHLGRRALSREEDE